MKKIDSDWLFGKWQKFLVILRIDLYSFQAEMAEGLLQLPEYADCTQTRQSGKSFLLGVLIYFLMYTLRWDVVIVAPRLDGTDHIMGVVSKIATWMQRKKGHKGLKHPIHSTRKIQIAGRGSVKCITGDPFAQVEGSHAHLIVLDEKQDLDKEHIVNNIVPFTGFFNGLIWSLGIGGAPGSWGEDSRKEASRPGNFVWKCPWQRVVQDKPEYLKVAETAKRKMMPAEFGANYECEELDMSLHMLINRLAGYKVLPIVDKSFITVGLDFGSIDKTVATVSHRIGDVHYWNEWKIWSGDYSIQRRELANWLKNVIVYDRAIGEYNGVGRSVIDELNGDGLGIIPIQIDQKIKNDLAHKMRNYASEDKIQYNESAEFAGPFYENITNLKYKMTDVRNVKVDHSDFYSSGILTLLEAPKMRLSA